MKYIIRKALSILMIMLMILPCTMFVYAEDTAPEAPESVTEQDAAPQAAPVQAEPAPEVQQDKPVQAEPEAEAVPAETEPEAAPADETPAEAQTEQEAEAASEEAVLPESSGSEEKPSAAKSEQAPAAAESGEKNITISGIRLDGTASGSGNGWSYDKDSDTIALRDFNRKADITSDGTGVTIVTSGLNRIGTLSCDGNVDVIGAGVLLIDKIELAENCDFNLLPDKEMYGENGGGAAVFLRQEDNSYRLINGSVKGVIDETINLTDGTTLVLPADSSLELKAFSGLTTYDDNGNAVSTEYGSFSSWDKEPNQTYNEYSGHLKVSNLILEAGAIISNLSMGRTLTSSIEVYNKLVNDGAIYGGIIEINGDYSGSGDLGGSSFINKEQETSYTIIDGAKLFLNGKQTVTNLTSKGKSDIYYDDATVIETITVTDSSSITITSRKDLPDWQVLKLTGSLSGGKVTLLSGIVELANGYQFLSGGTLINKTEYDTNSGAVLFNYSTLSNFSNGINGPVLLGPNKVTVPAQDHIPVVSFNMAIHYSEIYRYYQSYENYFKDAGEDYTRLNDFNAAQTEQAGTITFDDLYAKYKPAEALALNEELCYEVFSFNNKKLSVTVLSKDHGSGVSSEGVFLIRMVRASYDRIGEGGTSQTSTLVDRTGAGTIGGNSKSILKGTGITRYSSQDDPDPEPKPDPEPDPDPDPDPDPVKPASSKSAAVSSVLTLQINEYDLNEGTDNTEKAIYYNLTAYLNGSLITELSSPVEAAMDYTLPEEFQDKPLYAVFANEDETSDEFLCAYHAEYDEENGVLSFVTSQTGEFVIVPLEFDGEEFSSEFYDELEKTKEVQPLIELLKKTSDL